MRRLTILVVLALLAGACGDSASPDASGTLGDSAPPDASGTLGAFVEAYNADDLEGVMALFAEHSVMVGHPANAFAVELDDIRDAFADDVEQGLSTTISIVRIEELPADDAENVAASSFVTWEQTWTSNVDGEVLEVCWSGNTALISGGTIFHLSWSRHECS